MNQKNPKAIKGLIISIILCFIWFEFWDWSRLWSEMGLGSGIRTSVVLTKFFVSIAMTVLLLMYKSQWRDKSDGKKLLYAFIGINLGDLAFSLSSVTHFGTGFQNTASLVGIVVFLFAQILLLVRLFPMLKSIDWSERSNRRFGIMTAIMLFVLTGFMLATLESLQQLLENSFPFIALLIYGIVVTASVWGAMQVQIGKIYPELNKSLIIFGMLSFLACDTTVGFNLILKAGTTPKIITESSTWIFYAPALFLLVQSVRHFTPDNKNTEQST